MAQVKAVANRTINTRAEVVMSAITDYMSTRPKLLTAHFSEYEVREGGTGAGTVVHWKFQATQKRVRDCLVTVTQPEGSDTVVETDANSSMVTTWTVRPDGDARSAVRIETTWNGAGGIAGFFERIFAPLGLRKIYAEMLSKLDKVITETTP